jgi:hypothetical protein
MRLNIPPLVTYLFGSFLVVFGIVRAKYLAAPRTLPPSPDEDEGRAEGQPAVEAAPVRGKAQLRHLRWGVVYILLGLFLVISTYLETRRR